MKICRSLVSSLLVCAMLCLYVATATASAKMTRSEQAVATQNQTQAEQAIPQVAANVPADQYSTGVTTEKVTAPAPVVVYLGDRARPNSQLLLSRARSEPPPVPRE